MTATVETNTNPQTTVANSIGKLVALCAFAAMMSTFGPFALVAPAAIALAYIHFGVVKVLITSVLMAAAIYTLGGQNMSSLGSVGTFIYSCLIGLIINQFTMKKVHPVKGILFGGSFAYLALVLVVGVSLYLNDTSIEELLTTQINVFVDQLKQTSEYQQIISAGGDQARELKDLVTSPNKIVEQFLNWIPSVVFIGIFFSLWASFYFVLRNSLAWRTKREYPFGLLHLTFFKLPFGLVYLVIVGLIMALIGNSIDGYDFSVIGFNILYSLGALFFFQGFGVVYDFLTVKGYRGLFKSLLITIAVVFMWRFVVLIGLLDLWINFRKFYFKKIEGDNK